MDFADIELETPKPDDVPQAADLVDIPTRHERRSRASQSPGRRRSLGQWVEQYSDWAAWESLTKDDAGEVHEHLAGLPSSAVDSDEEAKRFDLLVLRRQLAQLHSDAIVRAGRIGVLRLLLGRASLDGGRRTQ